MLGKLCEREPLYPITVIDTKKCVRKVSLQFLFSFLNDPKR